MLGQKDIHFQLNHIIDGEEFALNKEGVSDLNQVYQFTRVDYYLSGFVIIHDGGMETPVSDFYVLAKGGQNLSVELGSFNLQQVEGLKFAVGVESPTNNEDPTGYDPSHPLAPKSPSMHWGWSSGYRFAVVEGKSGPAFNTTFQMHGLWNQNYFEQTHLTSGTELDGDVYLSFDADINKALNAIDIEQGPIDHGSNATDLVLLENMRDHVFSPGVFNSVVNVLTHNTVVLYPNPSSGEVSLSFRNNAVVEEVQIVNQLGQTILIKEVNARTLDLFIEERGVFQVVLKGADQEIAVERLVIQ